MCFIGIKFPNKELVMTQVFAFFKLKKQTSKLSSWLPCNLDIVYRWNTKWGPVLVSTIYCNFQTLLDLQANQKNHIDDLIMTAWWPMDNFQNRYKMRTITATCLQKSVQKRDILNASYYSSFIKLLMWVTDNKSLV